MGKAQLADKSQLILRDESLKKHSYFGTGGTADFFAKPQTQEDLLTVLEFCKQKQVPYRVIGAAANTLFSDQGYRGCLISMLSFEKKLFEVFENQVRVSASRKTSSFVRQCAEKGFSGMEFLSFIPGTIGGTLVMNAGCLEYVTNQYHDVSEFVQTVEVLESGKFKTLTRERITFDYRKSSLRDKVVLFATFQLKAEKIHDLKQRLKLNYQRRAQKIPMKNPSLGSMFKNPKDPKASAGQLIEAVGLKGAQEGGVIISPQHGNVFENLGDGTSADVLRLIERIQTSVREKFSIELELEIDYIE